MNYRPPNWENPLKIKLFGVLSQDQPEAVYEAGADAMLEGLRKRGWRIRGDIAVFPEPELTFSSNDMSLNVIIPNKLIGKCCIAIIPDEEEKDELQTA